MSENNFSENKPKLPSHIAYSVNEGKDEKNHWQKIGAAWPTKDGGLSLKLNAIPIDGQIALRSREELDRMRAQRQNSQEPAQSQSQQIAPKH